jgi:hypothetical protein
MIKGLTPRLMQMGNIKIGKKGEERTARSGNKYRKPETLDHILITTMQRGPDENLIPDHALMKKIKESAKNGGRARLNDAGEIIELPIKLLYNDIDLNFPTRYAAYVGKKCVCSGDGETAIREGRERPCPCDWLQPDQKGIVKCKPNGALTCILEESDYFGGCHRFHTTSYNTVVSMLGSLALIQTATRGRLAGIPLNLVISPKTVTLPTGGNSTIQIVSAIYKGSVNDLQATAIEYARTDATYHKQIEMVEQYAREQVNVFDEDDEGQRHTAEEFYPDDEVIDIQNQEREAAAGPSLADRLKQNGGGGNGDQQTAQAKPEPTGGNATATDEMPDFGGPDHMKPITEVGNWKVGDTILFPINGNGEEPVKVRCEIVRFENEAAGVIRILDEIERGGKQLKGLEAPKPISEFLPLQAADAEPEPAATEPTAQEPEEKPVEPLDRKEFINLKKDVFTHEWLVENADRIRAIEDSTVLSDLMEKARKFFGDKYHVPGVPNDLYEVMESEGIDKKQGSGGDTNPGSEKDPEKEAADLNQAVNDLDPDIRKKAAEKLGVDELPLEVEEKKALLKIAEKMAAEAA